MGDKPAGGSPDCHRRHFTLGDMAARGAPHSGTSLLGATQWAFNITAHCFFGYHQPGSFQVQQLCPQKQCGSPTAAISPNAMLSAPSSYISQFLLRPAAISPNFERPQQPCHPIWSAPKAFVNGNLDCFQQVCHQSNIRHKDFRTLFELC